MLQAASFTGCASLLVAGRPYPSRTRSKIAVVTYFALVLVVLHICVDAHAAGEEFTYLRMFQHNENDASKGKPDNGYKTGALANANQLSERRLSKKRIVRRQLQSNRISKNKAVYEGKDETDIFSARDNEESGKHTTSIKRKRDSGKRKKGHTEEQDVDGKSNGSHTKSSQAGHPATVEFKGIRVRKNGENIQQLTYMLMRLLKQYHAKSMTDVPCRAHASWMPSFLEHLEKEIPNFKYYCVDTSKKVLRAAKNRAKARASAKFILKEFWNENLPRSDFVFSWTGLENMKQENVVKFLENVAKSERHKYLAIGSYHEDLEEMLSDSASASRNTRQFNLRHDPFFLPKPFRIISELSTGPVQKQLYLYRPEQMLRAEDE